MPGSKRGEKEHVKRVPNLVHQPLHMLMDGKACAHANTFFANSSISCPALLPFPQFLNALLCPPCMQALEYQLQQGIADTAKVDACLMPASARHTYGAEAHCAVGVIRRLQEL